MMYLRLRELPRPSVYSPKRVVAGCTLGSPRKHDLPIVDDSQIFRDDRVYRQHAGMCATGSGFLSLKILPLILRDRHLMPDHDNLLATSFAAHECTRAERNPSSCEGLIFSVCSMDNTIALSVKLPNARCYQG